MSKNLKHHELKAALIEDKHGPAVMLEHSEGWDEPSTVILHPHQLRAVCEQFGILTADPQAAKAIATLQRRMKALHDRIEDLSGWMAKHSDHRHADLSYELTTINALADLASEWVADFETPEQSKAATLPDCVNTECTSAPAPANQGSLI